MQVLKREGVRPSPISRFEISFNFALPFCINKRIFLSHVDITLLRTLGLGWLYLPTYCDQQLRAARNLKRGHEVRDLKVLNFPESFYVTGPAHSASHMQP